jgi:prolyl-tRNA synthetase
MINSNRFLLSKQKDYSDYFVLQSSAGNYIFTPYGAMIKNRIESYIHQHMVNAGFTEVVFPAITPISRWVETKRLEKWRRDIFIINDIMFNPTCEEEFVIYAKSFARSYKDLAHMRVYQITDKFRNEARPQHGLQRTLCFRMKDAYSACLKESEAKELFNQMEQVYLKIFEELRISVNSVEADASEMGGILSKEIQCAKTGLELGHIFVLGGQFSRDLEFTVMDANNQKVHPILSSYGIGIGRLMQYMIDNKTIKGFDSFFDCIITSADHPIPSDQLAELQKLFYILELPTETANIGEQISMAQDLFMLNTYLYNGEWHKIIINANHETVRESISYNNVIAELQKSIFPRFPHLASENKQ